MLEANDLPNAGTRPRAPSCRGGPDPAAKPARGGAGEGGGRGGKGVEIPAGSRGVWA